MLNLGFFEWNDIISNIVGIIIRYCIVFTMAYVFEEKGTIVKKFFHAVILSYLQCQRPLIRYIIGTEPDLSGWKIVASFWMLGVVELVYLKTYNMH